MINKRVIYQNSNNALSIITPAPEMFDSSSRTRQNLTNLGITFESDEEILNYIISTSVPPNTEFQIVNMNDLPKDRAFRAAWKFNNNQLDIDIEKAQEIHKNLLRTLRKPLLEQLDILYQRADETQDTEKKLEIVNKKQTLRNITSLPLSNDPEILKTQIPDILTE